MPRKKFIGNTEINFLYRDADNYKSHNSVVVAGVVTPGQIKAILECCDEGTYFVPEMVGLPCTRFDEETEADHPFCELYEDSFGMTKAPATVDISICELVGRFKSKKSTWDTAPAVI